MRKALRLVIGVAIVLGASLGPVASAHASCTQPTTEDTPCAEAVVCETAGRVLDWMCID